MKTINVKNLKQQYVNQIGKILDVRSSEEYALGHIPGALNIPHNQLKSRMDELPAQRPLFVICEKGGRSIGATMILKSASIDAICVSPGGVNQWIKMGFPVIQD